MIEGLKNAGAEKKLSQAMERGWILEDGASGPNDPLSPAALKLDPDPVKIALALVAGAIDMGSVLQLLPLTGMPSVTGEIKGQVVELPSEGRPKPAYAILSSKGLVAIPYIPPKVEKSMRDAKLGLGVITGEPAGVFLSSIELNGKQVDVPRVDPSKDCGIEL